MDIKNTVIRLDSGARFCEKTSLQRGFCRNISNGRHLFMKRTHAFLGGIVAFLFLFSPLLLNAANPVGEQVVSGSVSFDRTVPGVLSIGQGSDRAIIDWQDFSIGADNLTKFLQPGASSAALNRVVGGNPSSIYGQLQANGQIFLINPAGILVGASGQVDTKGLVASTLDLSNESFLSNARLTLSGDSDAAVQNLGQISASGGNVYLIARSVDNSGSISASVGTVGLGGGSEVVLSDGGISVLAGSGSVDNSGAIAAASAELKAAGGNIYALAINNSGVVRANSLVNEGGRIVLKADGATAMSSGSLSAAGGEVQLLGGQVGLDGSIDVSGGGTALVGGGFQGNAAGVLNAQRTVVGKGATIDADGGTVVVWADGSTSYNGNINAPGADVEVSGKETLAFTGGINAEGGSILLDPRDLTVVTSGADDSSLSTTGILAAAPDATTDVTISASALTGLSAGTIVVEASRDLSINTAVAMTSQTSANSVTFTAGDDLTISGAVSTGGAPMTFNASSGGNNVASATLTIAGPTTGGDVTFLNDGGSGGIVLSADIPNTGKDVTFSSKTKVGADVTVTGTDITFSDLLNGDTANTRELTVTTSGTATFAKAVGGTLLKALTIDGTGAALVSGGSVKATTLTVETPVEISKTTTITATDAQFDDTVNAQTAQSAALTINASNNTIFGGAVGTGSGSGTITTLTTDSSGATTTKGGAITASTIKINDPLTLGANTTLTGNATLGGTVDADLAANSRTLTINSSGTSNLNGAIGSSEALGSITSNSGGITVIKGSSVTATTQDYSDTVNVTADTTIVGTTVSFNGAFNGASKTVNVNASGVTTFGDKVGNSGTFTALITDAAGTVAVNTTTLKAKTLTLNDPVTLGADVVVTAVTQANIVNTVDGDIPDNRTLTLNSADAQIQAAGVIGGSGVLKTLTTDTSGFTTIDATSLRATTQTYNDQLKLGANLTLTGSTISVNKGAINKTALTQKSLTINANLITTIAGTSGSTTQDDGLTSIATDAVGTTVLGTGSIYAEALTFKDAVELSGNVTLGDSDTGTDAAFAFQKTVDGTSANNRNLTLSSGVSTFTGVIGGTKALGVFTIDSTDGTETVISGGTVNAKSQLYNAPVSFTADTTLAGTTVTIGTTGFGTDSAHAMTVNATGVFTIDEAIASGQFTTFSSDASGTMKIDGNVTTSGAQTYSDAVTIGVDSSSTTYVLDAGSGAITFGKTIEADSAANLRSLTVTSSGLKTFSGNIGNSKKLDTLTIDGGGSTSINATAVKATDQIYTDNVVLAKPTGTMTITADDGAAGGSVTFTGTLDGTTADTQSLTINSDGATTFSAVVGGTTGLKALITDDNSGSVSDSTLINGGAVTAVTQTYNDAVVLNDGSNATTLTGATIEFASTLDGTGAATEALTINASGVTTFQGIVGGTTTLLSLTTDLAGSTEIETTALTASTITYNDAVNLDVAASSTVTMTGATAVKFLGTLNADKTSDVINLTTAGGGATTFGGTVGGSGLFAALDASANTVNINTGAISSTTQTYGATTIGATATLTGTAVTFNSTVNADAVANARALTVDASAATTFTGVVGGTAKLGRVSTDSSGTAVIGGNVTADTITFNDPLTLNAAAILTGANDITLNGAVTAGANNLTVNADGTAAINAAITGTGTFETDSVAVSGTTKIGADITTTGTTQTYNDAVEIGADLTLTGTVIDFVSTVNADLALNDRVLTIVDAGDPVFQGAVGGTDPLGTLTVTAGTKINVDGGSVDVKTQTYNQPVEIAADTVIKATTATFTGAISAAAAEDLTISVTGTTTLTAGLTDNSLTDLTIDNGGSVSLGGDLSTKGNIVIDDALTLTGAATLETATGKNITLNGAVTGGANALTVTTDATATFAAAVSGVTTLDVAGTGATTVGADLNATTLSLDDAVTLSGDVTLTGTLSTVSINGSAANYDLTLVTASPRVGTVAGDVEVEALSNVNDLTFSAAVDLQSNAGDTKLTTLGKQTYNGTVGIVETVILEATDIDFAGGAVSGTANMDLTLSGTGVTTIGQDIGLTGTGAFDTDSGGVTLLNADVSTASTGTLTFTDAIVMGANSSITAAGNAPITLGSVVGNGKNLGLDSADTGGVGIDLTGVVTGVAILTVENTEGGDIELNKNVTATGAQTYTGPVILGADVTVTGTTITTTDTIDATGQGLQGLTIVGNAVLGDAAADDIGATTELDYLSVSGTTTMIADIDTHNAGGSGAQTYTGAVTLTTAPSLTATTAGDITFGSTVTGAVDLGVVSPGAKTFTGAVDIGVGDLTAAGGGTTVVTADVDGAILTFTDAVTLAGDVSFNGTTSMIATAGIAGATFDLHVASTDQQIEIGATGSVVDGAVITGFSTGNGNIVFANAVDLKGTIDTGTGNQTYTGAVVLNADTSLTGGTITTLSTVDATGQGLQGLAITGNAVIGDGTADDIGSGASKELDYFTVSGTATVNTDLIETHSAGGSGNQTYTGAVTLAAAPSLVVTTGGAVTFGSTVTSAGLDLDINSPGAKTFTGAVTLGAGTLRADGSGTTVITADVTATGGLELEDAITLAGDVSLTGTLSTASINGSGSNYNLTLVTAGPEIGAAAVNTVDVDDVTNVGDLTFSAGTTLEAGTLTTTGTQLFEGAVELGGDVVLVGTTITTKGTVDAATTGTEELTITGNAVIGDSGADDIGATAPLGVISISGTSTLYADISTDDAAASADQTFTGAVTLAADVVLTAANGDILFSDAIDGSSGDYSLEADGTTVVFTGVVTLGAGTLTADHDSASTTTLTTDVSATGGVDLNNITLAGDVTMTGALSTAAAITGGSNNLKLVTANPRIGTVAAQVEVEKVTGIADLIFDSTVTLDNDTSSEDLSVSGALTFNDPVTLAGNVTMTATSGITTASDATITGAGNLKLVSAATLVGDVSITGTMTTVGATSLPTALTTTGDLHLTTADATLVGNTVITADDLVITAADIVGAANDLTLDVANLTTLSLTDLTGVKNFTLSKAGTLTGDISTTGTQDYNGALTLGGNITMTSSGTGTAGDVTFGGTINAAQSLAVDTAGTTWFKKAVGGTTPVTTLVTDSSGTGAGSTKIGSSITAATAQTYNDSVILTSSVVLGGAGTLQLNAVNGGSNNLTMSAAGTTTLLGSISDIVTLTSDGGSTTTFGASGGSTTITVTSTSSQTYSDNLIIEEVTILTGSPVTYLGTVTETADLTPNP